MLSSLPGNWRNLVVAIGEPKRLRMDKSAEKLLRVLLIHRASGHSMHETAVRARRAQPAELSAVALWHWPRKSQAWLRALYLDQFRERPVDLSASADFQGIEGAGLAARQPQCITRGMVAWL